MRLAWRGDHAVTAAQVRAVDLREFGVEAGEQGMGRHADTSTLCVIVASNAASVCCASQSTMPSSSTYGGIR
ncbi:hypothetical protein C266_23346 [Pandoraea sp. SD6-2]|nr:hypothetical protein C266_23346 [Pandoraea sp. SD6-2]